MEIKTAMAGVKVTAEKIINSLSKFILKLTREINFNNSILIESYI